jgi:[ribosomal protein S5]-alanine N-acetyltransferase
MRAPILESARLIFRPVSLAHLTQDYVDWLNDSEVNRYLETGGNYSLSELKEFLSDVEKKDIFFWAIHLKINNSHIGNIKIDPINKRHGLGEYGILLGRKSEWGKGYAKEASQRIIQYCFTSIGLRKITLGVVADNLHAVKLYEKLDFIKEGIYKNHGLYQGKYCDIIRMAIFNPNLTY